MLDPLSLLPLALAAHGGRVDDFEAQQLVAAGLTLLQRSAPLVRALAGKRSAILLPPSPQFLVALAASEGRGALLLEAGQSYEIAHQLAEANVGAVFTMEPFAALVPEGFAHVLLDHAPWRATVVVNGAARKVDTGSHSGFTLEGDPDAAGSDEEAVVVSEFAHDERRAVGLTHRELLSTARSAISAATATSQDCVLSLAPFSNVTGLTLGLSAPLLSGARVVTTPRSDPRRAIEAIGAHGITVIVAAAETYRALLATVEAEGAATLGGGLRLCVCAEPALDPGLQARWRAATGAELRPATDMLVL